MYNRALYTYINVSTNMHLHWKPLHPLCSWSGCGPGWDRGAAFLGSSSNVSLHRGRRFPLEYDYFRNTCENYGKIEDAYRYQPKIVSVLAVSEKDCKQLSKNLNC
jgi:hypothetical protein